MAAPGARGVSVAGSALVVVRVGEPVDDVGVGHQDRLRLVGTVVLDDVAAARVRILPFRGGAGHRGKAPSGVGREPRQDDRGEQLVGRRHPAEGGGVGPSVEDDVDVGNASYPEGFLAHGDGRGRLRVILLPEGLLVAGELTQRGVGLVDGDDQARHAVQVAVEVEAAFRFGGEVD